jgi:alkanesulfonate monooxygenase SsuD/methylene tetrahydromethanopterin reductase-like flavin-dependent oxidoreductase (luciferase family)
MRFGFGLITCERHPTDPRPTEEIFSHALALAERAERLGFDSVWVSEHHFLDDGYLPSLLPMCAAIAARTRRIAVGTGVLLAPFHEPIRVAEDAAVVDLLSGGRLILGLGAGWRPEELDAFGVRPGEAGGRLERSVRILRQAWSDGLVSDGYPWLAVTPKPAGGGPPIWIGAMSEAGIRRAGRIADGFLATEVTPASFAEQVRWAAEERERVGRGDEPFTNAAVVSVFAWPGPDAWERVRDSHHYVVWKYLDMEGARGRTGPPPMPPRLSASEEEALRRQIVVGRPEEVAEELDRFRSVGGDGIHIVARLYWPGLDPSVQEEALAVFAEAVMPQLR